MLGDLHKYYHCRLERQEFSEACMGSDTCIILNMKWVLRW